MSHSAAASVQQYWAEQLDLLQQLPAAVHEREPESIHDLRAAGRRTKSTLRTFRPLVRQPLANALLDQLDRYNALLGQARDAEVVRAGAAEVMGEHPGHPQVDAVLAAEEHRTLQQAERMLDGSAAAELLEMVQELAEEPWRGDRQGHRPRPADLIKRVDWAERRLARAWGRGPQGDETTTAWEHRVRRRAKGARYACESMAAALPELDEAAKRYAEVARLLGIVQDTAIINRALQAWPDELVGDAMDIRDQQAAQALAEVPTALDVALRHRA